MYHHQLDTFIQVVKFQSFHRAAEALYISPSAIVQQMKHLEQRLHVTLFNRSSKGIELTEIGKVFYEDALRIVQDCQDVMHKIQVLEQNCLPTIKIGTSRFFQCHEILKYVPQLQDRYIIEMHHLHIDSSTLWKQVDILEGLPYHLPKMIDYRFFILDQLPVYCLLHQDHPLANREKLTLLDIKNEHLMVCEGSILLLQEMMSSGMQVMYIDYCGKDALCMVKDHHYIFLTHAKITQEIEEDLSTMKLIPLESRMSIPYGLMYHKQADQKVISFLNVLENIRKEA